MDTAMSCERVTEHVRQSSSSTASEMLGTPLWLQGSVRRESMACIATGIRGLTGWTDGII